MKTLNQTPESKLMAYISSLIDAKYSGTKRQYIKNMVVSNRARLSV